MFALWKTFCSFGGIGEIANKLLEDLKNYKESAKAK